MNSVVHGFSSNSHFARPVVVGIAGCSGSGKSTLALALARVLGADNLPTDCSSATCPPAVHFPIDHYYRDLSHIPVEERRNQNFDDPAMIEVPLLAAHVSALARGLSIERPLYDFSRHARIPGRSETIGPASLVIVEGLFALHYAELQPLFHLRVFVEAPDEICFERRLSRDMIERGRTEVSVRRQWLATVQPAAERIVKPSATSADLTLDGAAPVELNVDRLFGELRGRGLMAMEAR
jgi:uridine kinase